MTAPDPRWERMEASSSLQEITGDMLEQNIKPMHEFRIVVFYKGVNVWIKRLIHTGDLESLLYENEIFRFLWDEMVEKIDEGLDRVDAGEKEFDL